MIGGEKRDMHVVVILTAEHNMKTHQLYRIEGENDVCMVVTHIAD